MGTQTVEIPHLEQQARSSKENLVSRVAFRFCFVYFGLYCLLTQILTSLLPIPNIDIPDLGALWPTRVVVVWFTVHFLRLPAPSYADTGSGDRVFDWMLVLILLVVSAVATGIWSYWDRVRENYVALSKWFRVCIRISLAGQMMTYGVVKLVPLQMPYPYLTRLLEPFGRFSPMGVLWSSIGAAPAYEMFAGSAELVGGILLILPRTTTFGALVCLADMIQVFMLNMTYDVPVKLLSFHLILLSLFLLAPNVRRLLSFFFLDRATEAPAPPALFRSPRANRVALLAQVTFGIVLLAANGYSSWTSWHQYGGGRPRSPLYGIWEVEQFSFDGQLRAPLLTDEDRWRRVIFDMPTRMSFQHMNESTQGFAVSINVAESNLTLTKENDKNWKTKFAFQRGPDDHLVLDGNMDAHALHVELRRYDLEKFLLISRGFHWVQEHPFNR